VSSVQSTHPEPWFVATSTCTLATESGRVSTVARSRLITRVDGVPAERPLVDEAHELTVLREVFGVDL